MHGMLVETPSTGCDFETCSGAMYQVRSAFLVIHSHNLAMRVSRIRSDRVDLVNVDNDGWRFSGSSWVFGAAAAAALLGVVVLLHPDWSSARRWSVVVGPAGGLLLVGPAVFDRQNGEEDLL